MSIVETVKHNIYGGEGGPISDIAQLVTHAEKLEARVAELESENERLRRAARRDEGMFATRDLARVVPAGVDLTVGTHVLVVEGPDRGRVGTALSWRAAADGAGWQVSFAWPPWVTGRDLRDAIREATSQRRGTEPKRGGA